MSSTGKPSTELIALEWERLECVPAVSPHLEHMTLPSETTVFVLSDGDNNAIYLLTRIK